MITFLCLAAMTVACGYAFMSIWPKQRLLAVPMAGATVLSSAITLVWISDSLGFSDIVKSDVEREMVQQAAEKEL